jgi:hypothetical protein
MAAFPFAWYCASRSLHGNRLRPALVFECDDGLTVIVNDRRDPG